jgi:hypothetical protein
MRSATLFLAITATLAACSRSTNITADSDTSPVSTPTVVVPSLLSNAPPTTFEPGTTTTAPSRTAPNTTPPTAAAPTELSATLVVASTAVAVLTGNDPQQAAQEFIQAALDRDPQKLRALSDPSYREQAVEVWIAPTDDFGVAPPPPAQTQPPEPAPNILATKLLTNAAGQARVAVFADSNDLAVAALPFIVQLIDHNGQWLVLDASLPTT